MTADCVAQSVFMYLLLHLRELHAFTESAIIELRARSDARQIAPERFGTSYLIKKKKKAGRIRVVLFLYKVSSVTESRGEAENSGGGRKHSKIRWPFAARNYDKLFGSNDTRGIASRYERLPFALVPFTESDESRPQEALCIATLITSPSDIVRRNASTSRRTLAE